MTAEFRMPGRMDAAHADIIRIVQCGIHENHKIRGGDFCSMFRQQLMAGFNDHPRDLLIADDPRHRHSRSIVSSQIVAIADDERVHPVWRPDFPTDVFRIA